MFITRLTALCHSYPLEELLLSEFKYLLNTRIQRIRKTGLFRLEGISAGHLAQIPAQSRSNSKTKQEHEKGLLG